MQIACEKCSTLYTLDERLIPLGGAPVQCTRCHHVFVAIAAAEQPARSGTAIFGHTGGAALPQVTAGPVAPVADEDEEEGRSGQTQIFGKSPLGATPAPPSNPRSTQMFGAVGAPKPPESNPRSTQMFGAVGAPKPPEANPRSTQMFGAVGAPKPPESNPRSTQVFGAVGAPKPPESNPRSTQMFGAPAAATGPTPRPVTQMFGAVPAAAPAPEAPRSSTAMFGAVTPGAPAPEAQRNSTAMFGAVTPGAPAPEAQRSSTAMFGAVTPGAPAPEAPRSATAMFGAVTPGAPAPESPRSSTAMFGAVTPAGLPKITFGGAAQAPAGSKDEATVTEGGRPFALTDPVDIDPAMASTQTVKATDLAKALAAQRAAEAGPGPGMTAELQLAPTRGMTAELHLAPTRGMTAELQMAPTRGMTAELQMAPTRGMTAELSVTGAAPARAYAPVQLPPEAPLLEQLETPGYGVPAASAPRKGAMSTVAVLAIVALLVGGYFFFLHNRAPKIAPELAAAREGAVLLLRRDDPASRQKAVEELGRVAGANPAYAEARADLVAALSLQLDDARLGHERMLGEVRVLENEIERLTNAQSPSDWQNRVYVLQDQVAALRKDAPERQREAADLEKRLTEEREQYNLALQALKSVEPASARIHARGRALYASVLATTDARTAISELKQGQSDGWAEIAQAQYALNARASEGELTQARTAIEGVIASDSTFIRAYLLAARIAMRQERYEAAITALEAATALNPDHQTARELLTWAQASQRAVEAAGR